MRNAGLEEAQAGIKTARKNINNIRCTDDTTLMAESEEELKSLLMKVKEESGKSWLKPQHSENEDHGIWSHHFMEIDGETVETVSDFILGGSKVTADGDCSHELKRLAPWTKSHDQPRQRIKKQRHYFVNKGPSGQSYGFSNSHV